VIPSGWVAEVAAPGTVGGVGQERAVRRERRVGGETRIGSHLPVVRQDDAPLGPVKNEEHAGGDQEREEHCRRQRQLPAARPAQGSLKEARAPGEHRPVLEEALEALGAAGFAGVIFRLRISSSQARNSISFWPQIPGKCRQAHCGAPDTSSEGSSGTGSSGFNRSRTSRFKCWR
jgi:hypothetical protein